MLFFTFLEMILTQTEKDKGVVGLIPTEFRDVFTNGIEAFFSYGFFDEVQRTSTIL